MIAKIKEHLLTQPQTSSVRLRAAALAVFALLFCLVALPGYAQTSAGTGKFSAKFTELNSVRTIYTDTTTRLLILSTPSDAHASTVSINWPSGADTPIPPTMNRLQIRFNASNDADESHRFVDLCTRYALLTQADPAKYNLNITITVDDANEFDQLSTHSYRIDIDGAYTVDCDLQSVS